MAWLNFEAYSIVLNLAFFAVAAGVVWFAGSRISRSPICFIGKAQFSAPLTRRPPLPWPWGLSSPVPIWWAWSNGAIR